MKNLLYGIEWDNLFNSVPTKIVKTLPQNIDFTTPNATILIGVTLTIGFIFWWFIYD